MSSPTRRAFARFPRAWLCLAIPLLVAALAVARAHVAPAADASSVVSEMLSNAIGALNDKQLTARDREHLFRSLLDQDFDMPRIAQFVLGPYWEKASDNERQSFIGLFEQWIVLSYSEGLDGYDGETIKVTGSHPGNGNTMVVTSQVVDRAGTTGPKLDWVLRHDNDSFRIINVSIEGISLVMIERAQIIAVVERNGGTINGANDALQERLAASQTQHADNY
jgi:phospholipid transport system substrate-binding protein